MQQGAATRSLARRQHEPWETALLGIVAGDPDAGEAGQWPRPAYAWYVVATLLLAMTLAFVDRYVLSLLVEPIKAELRVSDTQIGLLQGVPFGIFYAIFGVPLGRLADQRNRRNLLAACVLLWSLFTAACGMAKGYALLFVARIGVAIGEAGLPPTTMSLISDYFPKDKRTKPFGLFMCGVHIGGGLALLVGGVVLQWIQSSGGLVLPLLGSVAAWRVAFVLVGLPGLLLVLLFLTVREPLRHDSAPPFRIAEVGGYLRRHGRLYAAIFCGMATIGMVGTAIIAWVPAMLMRVRGLDHQQVGYGFGMAVLIGGVSGALLAGWWEDWFAQRGHKDAKLRVAIACALGMIPFGLVGCLSSNSVLVMASIGVLMLLYAMPLVLGPAAIMCITPGRLRGQVGAVYVMTIGLVGGLLGPTLVPVLTDYVFRDEAALNYSLACLIIACCPLAALVFTLGRAAYRARVDQVD